MTRSSDAQHLELCRRVVERLLAAYFRDRASNRMAEHVLSGDVPPWGNEQIYSVLVYLEPSALTPAALLLKCHGPSYLEAHSFLNIKGMLREFIRRHYKCIHDEISTSDNRISSFNEIVSEAGREALVEALSKSFIFRPSAILSVFPFTPMTVEADFDASLFYIIARSSITEGNAQAIVELLPEKAEVGAWLGIRAPSMELAQKWKRIVLGAVALGPIQRERHSFTLRNVARGYLLFQSGRQISTTTSLPHTPPLGSNIVLQAADHPWLSELVRILRSSQADDKRKRKALEYYYQSWFLDEATRCPFLFMAIDALFGQGSGGTEGKVRSGIEHTLGASLDSARFKKLWLLRNQVLHGGAPDPYASSNYREYCRVYKIDPIYDLELAAAKCLRRHIFPESFRPQPDPFFKIIADAQTKGFIAANRESAAILEE